MDFEERATQKKSLGALRKTPKTKDRSPESTGKLKLQRHTFDTLAKQFADTNAAEIDCWCRLVGSLLVNRKSRVHYYGIDPEFRNREAYEGLQRRVESEIDNVSNLQK